MPSRVVFVDTNIFMHCQPLDQIGWLELLEAERVVIVVPSIVFRELDKHKDEHPKGHMKNRARQRLGQLEGWLDGDRQLRPGVSVEDFGYPPRSLLKKHGLAEGRNDDVLVASIKQYLLEHPEADVVLVAHDSGPRRTTKRLGIAAMELPVAYRLKPELDPAEKEVQALRQELQRLQAARPKPKLAFSTGSNLQEWVEVTIARIKPLTAAKLKERIDSLKNDHPLWSVPDDVAVPEDQSSYDNLPPALRDLFQQRDQLRASLSITQYLHEFDKADIDRYNQELKSFYLNFERHLRLAERGRIAQGLTASIDLVMVNDGGMPAEDVDVFMHFPDGFQVFWEGDLPKTPEPPKPPAEPKTRMEKTLMFPASPGTWDFLTPIPDVYPINLSPSNVSGLDIKKTKSYDVEFHVKRVKHHVPEEIARLYLVFHDFESASSFRVDYELKAANLPEPVPGQLHVKVTKRGQA